MPDATGPSQAERGISFLRHISSLSAGAIALQIGFLERVFPHPKWKALIAVSLVAFTVSIVSAVISDLAILATTEEPSNAWQMIGGFFVIAMGASFLVGLLAAVLFSLTNMLLL
jgi:hypothetical protein